MGGGMAAWYVLWCVHSCVCRSLLYMSLPKPVFPYFITRSFPKSFVEMWFCFAVWSNGGVEGWVAWSKLLPAMIISLKLIVDDHSLLPVTNLLWWSAAVFPHLNVIYISCRAISCNSSDVSANLQASQGSFTHGSSSPQRVAYAFSAAPFLRR